MAARNGRKDDVGRLLVKGVNVHYRENHALRLACKGGRHRVVKMLLEAHADSNAKDAYPLRVAVNNGDLSMMKMLLDESADPNLLAGSALRSATESGNAKMIKLLNFYGAWAVQMSMGLSGESLAIDQTDYVLNDVSLSEVDAGYAPQIDCDDVAADEENGIV